MTYDEKTFALLNSGKTAGIFLFAPDCDKEFGRESETPYTFKDYLLRLKPSCIEDLISLYALYRPGMIEHLDTLIDSKHGSERIKYANPILEDILGATYGVVIYQEQLMRIFQVIGGFSPGESDLLRRAVGRKDIRNYVGFANSASISLNRA